MARTIINGKDTPLTQIRGTVPDVSGALQDRFQLMNFTTIVKSVVNFQVVETPTTTSFWGNIEPMSDNQLRMLPEGQRTQWQWFNLYSEPAILLKPDEVVNYLGVQYRCMARRDYSLYGYMLFTLQTDWTGSGP